jgi:hypothetical protein
MPTIEDGIREYNKAISTLGNSLKHYEDARKIFEFCKEKYPHTMDIILVDQMLGDIDKKLAVIKV